MYDRERDIFIKELKVFVTQIIYYIIDEGFVTKDRNFDKLNIISGFRSKFIDYKIKILYNLFIQESRYFTPIEGGLFRQRS